MGYHINQIQLGIYGEFSKIKEEFQELEDGVQQNARILQLVELSDLYGAIEGFLEKEFNMTMWDLKTMSDMTKSAFKEGDRCPKK